MTTEPVAYQCEWPIDAACFEDDWDDFDTDVQDRAIAFASATLRRLTGYRVGGCPIKVRPCKPSCVPAGYPGYYDGGSYWMRPVNWGGVWTNSCGCQTSCACGQLCEIVLPPPVGRLDEVMIDGVEQTLTDFRVDDGRLLTWVGGGDCPFPACQDMALDDSEAGTFSVTYLNSYPVDEMGAYAAAVLAKEFAQACTGGDCRLPSNVRAITRQGVAMDIAAGTFPNGTTGIQEVDSYIGLWNPNALRQESTVWYPNMRAPRITG